MKLNPYANSTAVKLLQNSLKNNETPRLAFLDIDSTFHHPDVRKTNSARRILEKKGYAIIFNTSRTEELVMSEKERKASSEFRRPVPHLGKIVVKLKEAKKTIYYYRDPFKTEPQGILDADIIIGSTGTAIWIKQVSGGYKQDLQYRYEFGITSAEWRKKVTEMLVDLKKTEKFNVSILENVSNYERNRTNVYPPDFRIQVLFATISNLISFRKKVTENKNRFTANLRLTNDSKPDKGKYVLYLTPSQASKTHAQEHVIRNISKILDLERGKLDILIAGDSWPDLLMGINGKNESETFLLVGGSRLFKDLTRAMKKADGKKHFYHFSGESLSVICKRIVPTIDKGSYYYNSSRKGPIKIILGDEKYPGKKGVESVLAYLKDSLNQTLQ